jgi:hypothetical protein
VREISRLRLTLNPTLWIVGTHIESGSVNIFLCSALLLGDGRLLLWSILISLRDHDNLITVTRMNDVWLLPWGDALPGWRIPLSSAALSSFHRSLRTLYLTVIEATLLA